MSDPLSVSNPLANSPARPHANPAAQTAAQPVTPVAPASSARQQALSGYSNARDVEAQARVSQPMNDPEFNRAADKLDRILSAGRPLRDDVPRGFYINVRV